MPKRRNLDLAAEMGEEVDVTEDEANAANEIVPKAEEPEPRHIVAPTAPITLTFEQLRELLGAKPTESNADLVAAFTKGIENAREPIPENKFAPDVSAYNVLGDRAHPRPGLKCKFVLGTQDPKTKVVRDTYPYEDYDLTIQEQIALNTLEPWSGVVKRLDGADMKVSLVPTYNPITDVLDKLVIVVPLEVIQKGSQVKNMLPAITNLVEQITGHNYARLTMDDLIWFAAEHRAKRYVAVREEVPA